MIKWGILGCAKIAGKFAEDLHKVEGCELYAVGSRSIEKALVFAHKYQSHKAYGTYEELVQDEQLDVIYIAAPHPFHKENAILSLQNKKHVLCEKPLAMSSAEVVEMIAAAKVIVGF